MYKAGLISTVGSMFSLALGTLKVSKLMISYM